MEICVLPRNQRFVAVLELVFKGFEILAKVPALSSPMSRRKVSKGKAKNLELSSSNFQT